MTESLSKYGPIQAAEMVNRGKTYRAFLFQGAYYDDQGDAVRSPLLRSPLKYTRISSRFTYRRRHPIYKTVRPHLGVDYAAPPGTRVVAVANGVVTFAGWNGGFGRFVELRHTNGLTTSYAHLSGIARGVRRGRRIEQGDSVGRVGSSGVSTGPHLDFRMTRNGQPINPLAVKSDPPKPIVATLREAYFHHIAPFQLRLHNQQMSSRE